MKSVASLDANPSMTGLLSDQNQNIFDAFDSRQQEQERLIAVPGKLHCVSEEHKALVS